MSESKIIYHEGQALIRLEDQFEVPLKDIPKKALLEFEFEGEKLSDCISVFEYEQYKFLHNTEYFNRYFESQL